MIDLPFFMFFLLTLLSIKANIQLEMPMDFKQLHNLLLEMIITLIVSMVISKISDITQIPL